MLQKYSLVPNGKKDSAGTQVPVLAAEAGGEENETCLKAGNRSKISAWDGKMVI